MKSHIGDSLKVKRIQIVGEKKNSGRTHYRNFSIGMVPSSHWRKQKFMEELATKNFL